MIRSSAGSSPRWCCSRSLADLRRSCRRSRPTTSASGPAHRVRPPVRSLRLRSGDGHDERRDASRRGIEGADPADRPGVFAGLLAAFALLRTDAPSYPVGFVLGFFSFLVITSLATVSRRAWTTRHPRAGRGAVDDGVRGDRARQDVGGRFRGQLRECHAGAVDRCSGGLLWRRTRSLEPRLTRSAGSRGERCSSGVTARDGPRTVRQFVDNEIRPRTRRAQRVGDVPPYDVLREMLAEHSGLDALAHERFERRIERERAPHGGSHGR